MTVTTTGNPPPPASKLPSLSQIYAALRYVGVMAGTVRSVLAFIGAIDPTTAHNIVAAFQAVVADLTQLLGDMSKLLLLIIPVVTIWLAKIRWNSASPKSQIATVQAMPQAQVIVSDPKLAQGIPGVQVVNQKS